MEFVGRQEELERLGRFVASTEPAIAAVFGRRKLVS